MSVRELPRAGVLQQVLDGRQSLHAVIPLLSAGAAIVGARPRERGARPATSERGPGRWSRPRRAAFGELLPLDGSFHD